MNVLEFIVEVLCCNMLYMLYNYVFIVYFNLDK